MRPTENVSAEEDGELAAEYELHEGEETFGGVKVWSRGAYKARVGGAERTVIRVGFDVQNTSDEPIVFDPLATKVTTLKANDQQLENLPVTAGQGSYTIGPRSEGEIDVYFVLPVGVEPQHVDEFSVFWALKSRGEVYSEFTPFEEDDNYYGYYGGRPFYGPYPYAYDPFYDPLYYDPWYWSYYQPTYVISQSPGVIAREHGHVRQHGHEARAPRPTPVTQPAPSTRQAPMTTPTAPQAPVTRQPVQPPAPAPRQITPSPAPAPRPSTPPAQPAPTPQPGRYR